MEKNARVETGKTPSIHSGRPSETEKDGEAICRDEMNKAASTSRDIWEADDKAFIEKVNKIVEGETE